MLALRRLLTCICFIRAWIRSVVCCQQCSSPFFLIMQIIFPRGLTAVSVGTGTGVGRRCGWEGDVDGMGMQEGWKCVWDGDAGGMGMGMGWGCGWDGDTGSSCSWASRQICASQLSRAGLCCANFSLVLLGRESMAAPHPQPEPSGGFFQ